MWKNAERISFVYFFTPRNFTEREDGTDTVWWFCFDEYAVEMRVTSHRACKIFVLFLRMKYTSTRPQSNDVSYFLTEGSNVYLESQIEIYYSCWWNIFSHRSCSNFESNCEHYSHIFTHFLFCKLINSQPDNLQQTRQKKWMIT